MTAGINKHRLWHVPARRCTALRSDVCARRVPQLWIPRTRSALADSPPWCWGARRRWRPGAARCPPPRAYPPACLRGTVPPCSATARSASSCFTGGFANFYRYCSITDITSTLTCPKHTWMHTHTTQLISTHLLPVSCRWVRAGPLARPRTHYSTLIRDLTQ